MITEEILMAKFTASAGFNALRPVLPLLQRGGELEAWAAELCKPKRGITCSSPRRRIAEGEGGKAR